LGWQLAFLPLELTNMNYVQLALIFAGSLGIPINAGSAELSGCAADVLLLADDQNHETESVPHPLVKQVLAGSIKLVSKQPRFSTFKGNSVVRSVRKVMPETAFHGFVFQALARSLSRFGFFRVIRADRIRC